MPLFTCKKCSKTFDRKSHFERHKNRKSDCRYGSKVNKKIIKHTCKKCNKKFSRKDSLDRHAKGCKVKIIKTKIKGDDNNLIAGNKINSINKSPNSNIINSKIININLVVFSKDGVDNISQKDLSKILGSNKNILESIISNVNLNPNKPQHHNILYNDTKSSYGEVYENNTWIRKKIDEVLEILIDTKIEDLNEILNDMGDFLNEKSQNKIKETIKNFDCSRPGARKKLKSFLKPILYNNKDMIVKTRKLSKQQEQEIFQKEQREAEKEAKLEEKRIKLKKK